MSALTRLGLRLPGVFGAGDTGPLLPRLVDLGLAAERAGFDSLWVPEATGEPRSHAEAGLEPYTTLGALAVSTTTARLGALASPVPGRSPALLAKQATTVDVLSGGRAVLGLRPAPWRLTGRRAQLERLDEAAQVCRALFRHELSTFTGRHFRVEHAANRPAPVQVGGPPILLAGAGGRGLLAVAARHADAVFMQVTPAVLRRGVVALATMCERAGREPGEVSVIAALDARSSGWERSGRDALVRRTTTLRQAGAHGVVVEASATTPPDALERLGAVLRDLD
jgi:alkanesulfonate monooxygenase SsuD/methylene tetrahydromethanopterin reductase-like flavin-dependent oxidoreductase (luciferase family)